MRVLDLFAGLGGWARPFIDRGHEVLTLDFDPSFGTDIVADILDWDPEPYRGAFDLVLASPPCEKFSVMTIGRYWNHDHTPKNDDAFHALQIAHATRAVIEALAPTYFVVENPRGKLRKLPPFIDLERRTVWYCRLGGPIAKPTDLWGGFPPSLVLPPECHNGHPDHDRAPRGWSAKREVGGVNFGGTQQKGLSPAERAVIPYGLALTVCLAAEHDLPQDNVPVIEKLF